MDLSAHHVFCLQEFAGGGYDEAFARNVDRIQRELAAATETVVAVTDGMDMFCECCPHNVNGVCERQEEMQARSQAALKALGLLLGTHRSCEDLIARACRVSEEAFLSVCGKCEFFREGHCTYKRLQLF